VADACSIDDDHAAALIELGAVYWCPVPPALPSRASPAAHAAAAAAHDAARAVHGRGMELHKPRRAGAGDALPAGGYVRVHVFPKRFPVASSLTDAEWGRRIVATGPGWAVVS
jgi:hypothetical protein